MMAAIGTMQHHLRRGVARPNIIAPPPSPSSLSSANIASYASVSAAPPAKPASLQSCHGNFITRPSPPSRHFSTISSNKHHALPKPIPSTYFNHLSQSNPINVIMKRNHSSHHHDRSKPKLAHEWIVDGKVIPSNKMEGYNIGNDGKEVIVFLHGLLGNAKNLRTPAKKLTQHLPHYNALLLDIRGHGNSSTTPSSSTMFAQPHNFQSCVQDIFDTLSPLGLVGPQSPTAICGHSLGGRIALQYSHHLVNNNNATTTQHSPKMIQPPKQTWVLDSVPGHPDPSVYGVLRAISSLPTPIPSKTWLVDTLVKEHGMDKGVALWIATNLRDSASSGGGGGGTRSAGKEKALEWIFDLEIANELVDNFSEQCIYEMIRGVTANHQSSTATTFTNGAGGNGSKSMVQLVMAGRNKNWSKEIISELESIPSFGRAPSSSSSFQMHTMDKAGHWVHVDDLEGLLKLMVDGLQQR